PEGMAFTSGEHMQMTAAKNVAINAGSDISTGVTGNMTALAGEKLGLFARTGQLSLKASEGPVEMQAQNGKMALFAEKKLTMSSASDISFAGKKRITLTGGGSYLRLEAGKIEYGTLGTYLRRVKRTMAAGAASQQPEMPWLAAPVKYSAAALMQYLYHDDAPVVGAPFTATLADGVVRKGNLDGAGYLHLEDVPPGSVQVEFGPDTRNYLRKNKTENQQFTGTSLSEADIDSLIAKHSGGVE
ncbi:DUF2345 domain-containing protein, partial [Enterobacter cloacae]|uniref:DUF2345 domain-containing protein n=1 Tax=Enterobacter cloacae TaxID=550 RepID=UPI0020769C1B